MREPLSFSEERVLKTLRDDLDIGTLTLMALICAYFTIVGGEVFGHMVIGKIAFSEPPRSFAMFDGPYGLDSARFWDTLPPITMLLFLAALATNWSGPRRGLILSALIAFAAIGATSILYIYPQFRDLVYAGSSDVFDPEIQRLGLEWTRMGWLRWGVTLVFGLVLLVALRRPRRAADVA